MTLYHSKLKESTGDTYLDLLACAWAELFDLANAGDYGSRSDLCFIFGVERLLELFPTCITWDPRNVAVQLPMDGAL